VAKWAGRALELLLSEASQCQAATPKLWACGGRIWRLKFIAATVLRSGTGDCRLSQAQLCQAAAEGRWHSVVLGAPETVCGPLDTVCAPLETVWGALCLRACILQHVAKVGRPPSNIVQLKQFVPHKPLCQKGASICVCASLPLFSSTKAAKRAPERADRNLLRQRPVQQL